VKKFLGLAMRGLFFFCAGASFLLAETPSDAFRAVPEAVECKHAWRNEAAKVFDPMGHESFTAHYKRLHRGECFKEWLIVVYMAADNDLSPYSLRDLWEMEAVGSTLSMDVVVFRDGADDGMKYYYISRNGNHSSYVEELEEFVREKNLEELSSEAREERFLEERGASLLVSHAPVKLEEGDSGDIRTAGRFFRWAFEKFPSRRVMLIGWSHGEGFDSFSKGPDFERGTRDDTRRGRQGGFAFDEMCAKGKPCESHMAVTAMGRGMRSLLEEMRAGRPIDILGSDACLNQQLEFAYEWLDLALYVFGSSTIVQKKGFNYRTLLKFLSDRPLVESFRLAAQIPEIYRSSVSPRSTSPYRSYSDPKATMATWTVAETKKLAPAMNDVGGFLTEYLDGGASPVERILRREEIRKITEVSIRLGAVSTDFFNFLQALGTWMREKSEEDRAGGGAAFWARGIRVVNSAREVLSRSVLSFYVGDDYQSGLLRTSKGVSIWLPTSKDEYDQMYPKLTSGMFYRDAPTWAKFIATLY
jgi:hypothetical protein